MIRETSAETYAAIKESGLLSERRMQVYECLYNGGAMTAGEIYEVIRIGRANANISPRLNELRKMKAVVEVGIKKCESTGRNVILWATTDNLPESFVKEKRVTRKQLEAENKKLKEAIDFARDRFHLPQDVYDRFNKVYAQ